MIQFKAQYLLSTTMLGALLSLSACNGMFEEIYDKKQESVMQVKEGSFSEVDATEYDEWVYIDFKAQKVTKVKIGEEYEDQIPEDWDIALHRYDIKTNEGAALETSYTTIDDIKNATSLPEGTFVEDVWTTDKIAIDMSHMMEGTVVYTESYRNNEMSKWMSVSSAMPPTFTMSGKVYLLRLKDQSYVAINFVNYRGSNGVTGYISFDYAYPLTFGNEAEDNNQQ